MAASMDPTFPLDEGMPYAVRYGEVHLACSTIHVTCGPSACSCHGLKLGPP